MSDQDELIDHYVDRGAVASDTAFLSEELNKVLLQFNELQGIRLKLNVDSSWKDVSNTTIAAKQATDQLTSSLVTYKAAQQQVSQQQQVISVALAASTNSMKDNAELLVKNQLALAELGAAQKVYKQQLEDGKISLDQYVQKQSEAILRAQEYKTSIADLNKELKQAATADFAVPNTRTEASAQNAILTKQVGNTDLNDVQRITELNALIDRNNELIDANSDKLAKQKINIGNYPQAMQVAFSGLETELERVNTLLSAGGLNGQQIADLTAKQTALNNATHLAGQEFQTTTAQSNAYKESAKQIGLAYGVNSQVFKDYNSNVAKATSETALVSQAVKSAADNSNFFSTQVEKIGQGLSNIGRQIGRLVGIGLIFAGVDALVTFVKYLGDADTRLKDLSDTEANAAFEARAVGDAYEGTTKDLVKAYQSVAELTESFKLAEDGVISKTRAVKDYNETLGQSFGVVNTLDEAEKKLADHAEAYIQYTLLKAAAQVTLQKAAEKAAEAAIQATHTFETNENGDRASQIANIASQIAINANKKRIAAAEAEKEELLKITQDFYDQAAAIAKNNGLFFKTETLQQQQKDASDAIELQIQSLTRYENKANQTAAEDKNTYEIRRQALVNYANAQEQIINLQAKQQLLSAIGDPGTQSTILAKQQTQLQAARIQSQQKLEQLDDAYRLRRINAVEQAAAAELDVTIKASESEYKDESNGLDERLLAYKKFVQAEKELADLEFVQKLASAGFSPAEIQALENGQKVQIQGKKITNEELEALEIEHTDKMKALASTAGKDIYEIVATSAKRQEDLAKSENKGNFVSNAQDQYSQQLTELNDSLAKSLISVTTYNAKRQVIDQQYAVIRLATQVQEDDEKVKNLEKVGQELLDQELYTNSALQAAFASGDQGEIDANQKKLDALRNAEIKNAADLALVRKKAANDQVSLTEATIKTLLDAKKQEKAEEIKLEDAGIELIKNLLDAQYKNKISEIQSEITATQAKAQAEVTAEQTTTDSAAVQADKISNINNRAAQQVAQLTAQENGIKRKEAEVDRIASIAKITQQAITAEFDLSAKAAQATGTAALLAADPITAPYAPVAYAAAATIAADEIIVAGLAAVNIAAILASPLPAYKFGTQGKRHPGGLAVVGDGGLSELIETESGEFFRTPATATVMDVPKDAYVHPDADKMIRDMKYAAFKQSGQMPVDVSGEKLSRQLAAQHKQQTDRIVRAINDKQELHIQPGFNSLIMIQQYGANYKKWVGRALHHRN